MLERVVPRALSETARRIQAALLDPLDLDTMTLRVDASVGTALARDGEDRDEVLHRANVQMYAAKRTARAAAEITATRPALPSEGLDDRHRAPERAPA